jgi:hypothetical protein
VGYEPRVDVAGYPGGVLRQRHRGTAHHEHVRDDASASRSPTAVKARSRSGRSVLRSVRGKFPAAVEGGVVQFGLVVAGRNAMKGWPRVKSWAAWSSVRSPQPRIALIRWIRWGCSRRK